MTILTVFRNRLRGDVGPDYGETAARLEARARATAGFVSFKSFRADDGERVSIVEFEDEAAQAVWRDDAEHREAQGRGISEWYAEYSIKVCEVLREHSGTSP